LCERRRWVNILFQCSIGTREGCVSSPILFTLFINDLVTYHGNTCGTGIHINNYSDDIHALMFADDVSSVADHTGLNVYTTPDLLNW